MARYARVADHVVVELVDVPDTITVPDPEDEGSTIERTLTAADVYHPDLASAFRPAAADVEIGWRLVGNKLVEPEPEAVDLLALKERLKAQIDADAETERLKYITPGAGQAMTYQAKADEARRLMGQADPAAADPAAFPLLSAEISITAATLVEVAGVVLTAYQQWLVIGGLIEATRLGAKAAIDLAVTDAAARAVVAVAVWPQP